MSCKLALVDSIKLVLDPVGGGDDPCQGSSRCKFRCNELLGTTRFFVPEADYAISLRAVDRDGELLDQADGVTTPAPLVYSVRKGELTNMNVNLIIVTRCAGC